LDYIPNPLVKYNLIELDVNEKGIGEIDTFGPMESSIRRNKERKFKKLAPDVNFGTKKVNHKLILSIHKLMMIETKLKEVIKRREVQYDKLDKLLKEIEKNNNELCNIMIKIYQDIIAVKQGVKTIHERLTKY